VVFACTRCDPHTRIAFDHLQSCCLPSNGLQAVIGQTISLTTIVFTTTPDKLVGTIADSIATAIYRSEGCEIQSAIVVSYCSAAPVRRADRCTRWKKSCSCLRRRRARVRDAPPLGLKGRVVGPLAALYCRLPAYPYTSAPQIPGTSGDDCSAGESGNLACEFARV